MEGLIARLTLLAADAPTMISRETLNETTSLLEELRQAQEGRESLMISLRLADAGLETAAERFREYAATHAAKRTTEGDEKAQRNADMAYSLDCCRPRFPEDADQPLLKDDWRPIESAPKKRTSIFVLHKDGRRGVATIEHKGGEEWGLGPDGFDTISVAYVERLGEPGRIYMTGAQLDELAGWMPLPAPPTGPSLRGTSDEG